MPATPLNHRWRATMPLEYGAYSYKLAVAATLRSLIGSLAAVELVKIESSAATQLR